jgi:pre-mRNA-splicing factor 38A
MNQTDPFAESVHGTNPQYIVEKITRTKIYNTNYWKEECFGLTAEKLVDKALSLKYCGGTYGGACKPTKFMCLVLKMLQLQPEKEIVLEFIKNEDFKYVRVLGAFYMRLVGKPEEIYRFLEPLYNDYRKVNYRGMSGWECKHMDEFIDSLLNDELVCDIALPHLPRRCKLEDVGVLEVRKSVLDSEVELVIEAEKEKARELVKIKEQEEFDKETKQIELNKYKETEKINNSIYKENNKSNNSNVISSSSSSSSSSIRNERDRDNSDKDRRDRRSRSRSNDKYRRDDSRDRNRNYRDYGRSNRVRDDYRNNDHRCNSRDRYNNRDKYRDRDDSRDHSNYKINDRRRSRSPDDRNKYDSGRVRNYDNRRSPSRERNRRRSSSNEEEEEGELKNNDDNKYQPISFAESDDEAEQINSKSTFSSTNTNVEVSNIEIDKKLKKSSKKFDKIFGSKKSSSSSSNVAPIKAKFEEGSVEYWNEKREALGIKKLNTK